MSGGRERSHKRLALADPNLILNVLVPETVQRKAEEWQRGTRTALQQKQTPKAPGAASGQHDLLPQLVSTTSSNPATTVTCSSASVEGGEQKPQKSADHPISQMKTKMPQKTEQAFASERPQVSCSSTITRSPRRKPVNGSYSQELFHQSLYNHPSCTKYMERHFYEPSGTPFADSFFKNCNMQNRLSPATAFSCNSPADGGFPEIYSTAGGSCGNWYKPRTRANSVSHTDLVSCYSMDMAHVRVAHCPLEESGSKERTSGRLRKTRSSVATGALLSPYYGAVPATPHSCPQSPQRARSGCPGREGLRPRPTSANSRPSRSAGVSRTTMRLRYRPWTNCRKSASSFSDLMADENAMPACSGRFNSHASKRETRRQSQVTEPLRVVKQSVWPEHHLFDKRTDLRAAVEKMDSMLEASDGKNVMLNLCHPTRVASADDLVDLSVKETVDFFLNMASPLVSQSLSCETNCSVAPVVETQMWLSHTTSPFSF